MFKEDIRRSKLGVNPPDRLKIAIFNGILINGATVVPSIRILRVFLVSLVPWWHCIFPNLQSYLLKKV